MMGISKPRSDFVSNHVYWPTKQQSVMRISAETGALNKYNKYRPSVRNYGFKDKKTLTSSFECLDHAKLHT